MPGRVVTIRRWQLVSMLVVLTLSYAAGLWLIHRQTHRICLAFESFKRPHYEELTLKIRKSRAFEKTHPDGIPGIPLKLIQDARNDDVYARSKYRPQPCP